MYMGPSLENLVGVTQTSTWSEEDGSIQGTIKLYSTASGFSIAIVYSFVIPPTRFTDAINFPTESIRTTQRMLTANRK